MTTNAEKTHVINRQLLADLPDRLVELVHGNQAAPARNNVAKLPQFPHATRRPSDGHVDDVEAVWSREDAIAATASCAPRRGPNGPKIEKETTHHLLSRRRFMKMA